LNNTNAIFARTDSLPVLDLDPIIRYSILVDAARAHVKDRRREIEENAFRLYNPKDLEDVQRESEQIEAEIAALQKLPRAVAILDAEGCMQVFADPQVDVAEFDWQDYNAGDIHLSVPARFADLVPSDTPIFPTAENDRFFFKDGRFGTACTVEAKFYCYRDGSPAIRLVDVETGEPQDTCTVAMAIPPPSETVAGKLSQCVWIKEYAGLTKLLCDAGILDPDFAEAHSEAAGEVSPQLLTERALRVWARCDHPPVKKPAVIASLGM